METENKEKTGHDIDVKFFNRFERIDKIERSTYLDFEDFCQRYQTLSEKELLSKILIEKKLNTFFTKRIHRNIQFFLWITILALISGLVAFYFTFLKK